MQARRRRDPSYGWIVTGVPTAVRVNSHFAVAWLVRMQPWLRRTP